MTTETILTNYQIHSILHDNFLPFSTQTEGFARAIEQAVLQSPEIQALRKDAERLQWVIENWFYQTLDETWIFSFNEMWDAGKHIDLRAAIDSAMEQQK